MREDLFNAIADEIPESIKDWEALANELTELVINRIEKEIENKKD